MGKLNLYGSLTVEKIIFKESFEKNLLSLRKNEYLQEVFIFIKIRT